MNNPKIKRALVSVSDKLGLVDFARGLVDCGVEIYSTGGTRRHLEGAEIPVHDVTEYTGFPEIMDGRVKTLHPKVFAGILCRHDRDDDRQALETHAIHPFELVVVNLYPFEATIANPDVRIEDAIEKIDIGGPSLVRAAAKNSKFTSIATHPDQYATILAEVQDRGATTEETRRELMIAAFQHTANYDRVIAGYFAATAEDDADESAAGFPAVWNASYRRKAMLRYGENNHQRAALYSGGHSDTANLISSRQLNGKQLSYNNLLDLDAALSIVRGFSEPACAVLKHNNPCGAAIAPQLADACRKAFLGDPLSAFGSVVGMNRVVDAETAEWMANGDLFVEAIVAPEFSAAAIGILTTQPKWKKNVRLVEVGRMDPESTGKEIRYLTGGLLIQDRDCHADRSSDWTVATKSAVDEALLAELAFGWAMVRHVKSNAITLSRDTALCGVGAGQMSRVDSVEIAIKKAGDRAEGSILASDAFFPFADSISLAANAGIAAIIQPGGSVRDQEVIEACDEYGIPMVLTGLRHFKH